MAAVSSDYNIWAENLVKSNRNPFDRPDSGPSFGPWARRPAHNPTINPRAQMIEKYRQEMMDLVRKMKQDEEDEEEFANYELSLRDIVDRPSMKKIEGVLDGDCVKKNVVKGSRGGTNNGATRLILKLVLPGFIRALIGTRKKIAKISPKPSNGDCEERSCGDESFDSNSGRRNRGGMGSCYVFLLKHRSNSMKI